MGCHPKPIDELHHFQDCYCTTNQIKLVAPIIQNWTMFVYWNNHKPMVHFRKAPTVGLYKVRVLGEEGLRASQSVSYLCNPLYKWTYPIYIYIIKYINIYLKHLSGMHPQHRLWAYRMYRMTWIVKDSQADFFARSSKIICKQPTWTNHNQAYVPGGSRPRDWRLVI